MVEKSLPSSSEIKRGLVDSFHQHLSVSRQCDLVGLPRTSFYFEPYGESPEKLALIAAIDRLYTERPFYGGRKVCWHLGIKRKRAQRLMRLMGLEGVHPKRSTSRPAPGHRVYPYLLRDLEIVCPDHV